MPSRTASVAIVVLFVFTFAVSTNAATFTVTNTANSGAGSLRQAIIDANNAAGADTIVFSALFGSPQTITLATVLSINGVNDTLTITGPGQNLLTVSGGGVTQIFSISAGETTSISGMTLTGAINGAVANSGTLTFTNSTFSANADSSGGGAITNSLSLIVDGCTFSNNTNSAPGVNGAGGGAIRNTGTATISNSTFTGNSTVGGDGGGAIDNTSTGVMTIANSSFSNNATTTVDGQDSHGGAIMLQGAAQLTITGSSFTGNSALRNGGAIYYQPNTGTPFLSITDSTFSNNTSNSDNNTTGDGGALYITGLGTVTISHSTLNGNLAQGTAGDGGGIFAAHSFDLTNSTVSGNTAGSSGGGIHSSGTVVNIANSTIVDNTANGTGGGFRHFSGTVNVRNSIFANNTAPVAVDIQGTVNSQGYNLIETTTGATISGTTTGNITGQDPLLGPLANNFGPTFTHALLPGSPAMEAGDPVTFSATDQRGVPRPQNGDQTGAALPDIGAYEQLGPTSAPVTISGRVFAESQALPRARVTMTSASGDVYHTVTNSFGYFTFSEGTAGETYVISVTAKGFEFEPQLVQADADISDLVFESVNAGLKSSMLHFPAAGPAALEVRPSRIAGQGPQAR